MFQHLNLQKEKERLLQEKWTAVFIMYASANCRYCAAEAHFSLLPHTLKHRSNTRHILHINCICADTYTHTHTHIEETPPVWVFKSKQMLMSHLSVSLTSVLLLEQYVYSSMSYSIVCLALGQQSLLLPHIPSYGTAGVAVPQDWTKLMIVILYRSRMDPSKAQASLWSFAVGVCYRKINLASSQTWRQKIKRENTQTALQNSY